MNDTERRVAGAICCKAHELGCAAQHGNSEFTSCQLHTYLTDARAAIAAMPGEPVAWRYRFITSVDGKEWSDWFIVDDLASVPHRTQEQIQPLYAAPAMPATDADLSDPVAVHANMLRGTIAKPSWENIQHLYAAEFSALSHPSQGGWQPISTAPKDGRLALVYRPLARNSGDQPIAIKRLIGGHHHCWDSTVPPGDTPTNPTDGSCHVTHWMDFPAPPEVQP